MFFDSVLHLEDITIGLNMFSNEALKTIAIQQRQGNYLTGQNKTAGHEHHPSEHDVHVINSYYTQGIRGKL